MAKERIKWLDVLKFIGIVEIIFGHLGLNHTLAGAFIWTHHVPLFFFVSGAIIPREPVSFKELILKKSRTILLPWFFFVLLSVVVYALSNNSGASQILGLSYIVVCGCIRNMFIANSLWFLTCLFVICISFELIKRMKHYIPILLFCFMLFLISDLVLPNRPIVQPSWVWNVDSAMYYVIYYAIGYISFPSINKFLENRDRKFVGFVFMISGLLAIIFSVAVFFGHNPLTRLEFNPFLESIVTLFTSIIIIWSFVFISYFLKDIEPLNKAGQNTIYACGNEYIVKTMVTCILTSLGIKFSVTSPLIGLLYAMFILLITFKILMPIEKAILERVLQISMKLSCWVFNK